MFNRKAQQRFYTHNNYNPRFGPMPSPYPQAPQMMNDPNLSSWYPEVQDNRLQMEIRKTGEGSTTWRKELSESRTI